MQTEATAQENLLELKERNQRETMKLQKRLHRNLGSLNQMTGIDKDITTAERCIKALKKQLTARTIEDISVLKHHLIRSELNNRFKLDKVSSDNYDKLMVIMATYANYQYVPQDEYIYKIGDKAAYLYIIIQGSVSLYTSTAVIKYYSGYDYYCKLFEMKKSNDREILIQTLKENMSIYPIDLNDIDTIELIILKMIFNDIPNKNMKEDLEEVFPKTQITPAQIGIDFETQSIFKIDDIINDKIRHIPNEKILQYRFLMNNTKQNYIKIFHYELFEKFNSGGVFGDEIYNKYIHSAIVAQGTHLCKIDSLVYGEQLLVEKNKSVNRDITFLLDSFFMSTIPRKRFERDYFKYFIRSTYKKGEVIFNENEKINHLFFIQTGEIELSSYRTILEMYSLINELMRLTNDGADDICFDFNIKNNPNDLLHNIVKKIKTRLFIIINQELLGIESWYKMPFLFTATSKSDTVELYKIPLCHLREILNDCKGIKKKLMSEVKGKLSIIAKRLNNVNSISLSLFDKLHEIKEEKKTVHYKEKLLKNKQIVLNTNKMKEYRESQNNIFMNQRHNNHNYQLRDLKEKKEKKMALHKMLSLNPSIESIMVKKKKFSLPKIQETNISDSSFENRLYIKIKKEMQSINSANHSVLRPVNGAVSAACYTKPEVSAFLTEVTQIEKDREIYSNGSTEKKSRRNNRITIQNNTINQETTASIVPKKQNVYRSPFTIEKLKRYSVFNQNLFPPISTQPQVQLYQFNAKDNSSPTNNLLNLYQRNKFFNQIIENRRIEHKKYQKKMMDRVNLFMNPPELKK